MTGCFFYQTCTYCTSISSSWDLLNNY